MNKIKFILVYYTKSRYLGMKKENIKIFNNIEDLIFYRERHGIEDYQMYKQMV